MSDWTLLFELQWWHGGTFVQRFHVYDIGEEEASGRRSGRRLVIDRAWPLFDLQQAYKRLRAGERRAAG